MTRVLVTGAAGQLGSEVVAELYRRAAAQKKGPGHDVIAAPREHLEVTRRDEVLAAITTIEPEVIIHCAAKTAVDACETEPEKAFAVNALGTRNVAEAARLVDAHVLYVSTDYVFDGTSERPYTEWDRPNPLSVYGRSKLAGEQELGEAATIVRTSWVCGASGANMVKTILRLLSAGSSLRFVNDQRGCPSIAEDLAGLLVSLALERRPGIYHLTNQGETTWFGFAQAVVAYAGGDPNKVESISTAELDPPRPAPRPANSVLDNLALRLLGVPLLADWRLSTERLVAQLTR